MSEIAVPADGAQPREIQTLDILKLMECLPHRYPFLMVDKITYMEGTAKIVGVKNVTFNEPHFLGHFPGQPVMPGVLIVEGMAQTAGAACVASGEAGGRAKVVYFMTVDKCKFRKPVVPGDRLEYHMTRLNRRRNMWWFKGEAKVEGQLVAEAELGAMIVID
ncbi:3-hydroxyacyl-ACP dehydratase FabZ [Rhabdaerophilum sp. SD176]|uniref:3-hydroxyacyl-ACP dehydratase FabZ n=1 Tax=Rhabdaerophilum sp. SD176 TaxID=2983548 RepID=UPI0024E00FDE|nr:3-hydroxyacyl-ACP dehydratase FabZ [Rhabdaerophilum sp. SD176]